MARIGIIGAGLAGLTVAYRRARAGDDVVVFEATAHAGGQLQTERVAGLVIEHGAEGFVAGSRAVPALAEDLGVVEALVGQVVTRSLGYDGTRLVELAPGEAAAFLGFQVPRDELGQGIRTFRGGMGELAERLADACRVARVAVRREDPVVAIARESAGWRVATAAGDVRCVDALVVAVPARPAAELLAPVAGDAARALEDAPTLSSVTVTLAYARADVDHPLDATGFVVAREHQTHGFRACTFTSSKFAERAPPERASVRLFFRPHPADLAALDDDAWTERAHAALGRIIRLRSAPSMARVSRWADALPVFDDAHRSRVAALEAALAGGGIHLTGSAFHGAGIDAAVRSAEACARTCALATCP
jgi:oxygen-dependent protoporphyrinogen oxidase